MRFESRKVKRVTRDNHVRVAEHGVEDYPITIEANWRDDNPPTYRIRYAGGVVGFFTSEQLQTIRSMISEALSQVTELELEKNDD
jgi:hypothetical protein